RPSVPRAPPRLPPTNRRSSARAEPERAPVSERAEWLLHREYPTRRCRAQHACRHPHNLDRRAFWQEGTRERWTALRRESQPLRRRRRSGRSAKPKSARTWSESRQRTRKPGWPPPTSRQNGFHKSAIERQGSGPPRRETARLRRSQLGIAFRAATARAQSSSTRQGGVREYLR